SAPVAVRPGNDAGASGTAVTGSSGSGTGSLIVIGSGATSSRSGSGACSRAGGAGVAAGRGRSRMRPMTTPRSPRSTRVLQPRSILSIPVVEHVQTADETEAAEVHLARPRVVGDVRRLARPIGEQRQTVVSRPEGVRATRPRRARDDA